MSRSKKGIVAMMMISVLSLWFALPDVAQAKTVTIEGRSVHASLTGNSSSATATISYTEGSGEVTAYVRGEACNLSDLNEVAEAIGPRKKSSTPGGVSSSISVASGWKLIHAYSECEYTVYINGTTYTGSISDKIDL